MKPAVLLWIAILLLPLACTHLPQIRPDALASHRVADCTALYPQGKWQFVHTIEAAPPNGERQTLLGVSQVSSEQRTIHCVLMSLEGLVLFEADYDGRLQVGRALPPFDTQGFAQGLIDDLALMFLAPTGPPQITGLMENGAAACRWREGNGSTVDVVRTAEAAWQIRRFNAQGKLIRLVKPLNSSSTLPKDPLPETIVLQSPGMLGYTLTMTLVEARALEPAIAPEKRTP